MIVAVVDGAEEFSFRPAYVFRCASFHNLEFAVLAQFDLELSTLAAIEILHGLGAAGLGVTFECDVQTCGIGKGYRVVACVGVEI